MRKFLRFKLKQKENMAINIICCMLFNVRMCTNLLYKYISTELCDLIYSIICTYMLVSCINWKTVKFIISLEISLNEKLTCNVGQTVCSTFCFSCQYSPHLYPNIFPNMVIIRRDTPLLDINDVESANFLQDLSASWNLYLFLFFLEILQYCCPFAYYCVSLQSNVQRVLIILGNGSTECSNSPSQTCPEGIGNPRHIDQWSAWSAVLPVGSHFL